MSLLAGLVNNVKYQVAQVATNPEAEAYAKSQANQKEQDAQVAADKKAAEDAAADLQKEKDAQDAEAASLAARSQFSTSGLMSSAARGILIAFGVLAIVSFAFYGGHLAANENIGYSAAGRVVAFIYGCLLSPIVIAYSLYKAYWKGETLPYYTFFPLSTYVPQGTLETIFLGQFCYQDDDRSRQERAKVMSAYKAAFDLGARKASPSKAA